MSFITGEYPDFRLSQFIRADPHKILTTFDKIIEKLIHKRLYYFLEEHNLNQNKFGFRKNNSTLCFSSNYRNDEGYY